jgi:hypothetical protein
MISSLNMENLRLCRSKRGGIRPAESVTTIGQFTLARLLMGY